MRCAVQTLAILAHVVLASADSQAEAKVQQWKKTYASHKQAFDAAVDVIDKKVEDLRNAARNRTTWAHHADRLAQDAQTKASDAAKKETDQAVSDYTVALTELQSADPAGGWTDAEKVARQKSDRVDEVQKNADKEAMDSLKKEGNAQKDEVSNNLHKAKAAAKVLLKDRNHLEDAERDAGRSEQEYEGEEEKHETETEDLRDHAENQKDTAQELIELTYEHAESHLEDMQHQNRKERRTAAQQRHQEIHESLTSLRQAAQVARREQQQRAAQAKDATKKASTESAETKTGQIQDAKDAKKKASTESAETKTGQIQDAKDAKKKASTESAETKTGQIQELIVNSVESHMFKHVYAVVSCLFAGASFGLVVVFVLGRRSRPAQASEPLLPVGA